MGNYEMLAALEVLVYHRPGRLRLGLPKTAVAKTCGLGSVRVNPPTPLSCF